MIIKTEAHYRSTLQLKAEWEGKIRDLRANPPPGLKPEHVDGECADMEYQVGEFQRQLAEFESVRDGEYDPVSLFLECESLRSRKQAFGRDLLLARLASGVTEEDMAEYLNITVADLRVLEDGVYFTADMDTLERATDLLTGGLNAYLERERTRNALDGDEPDSAEEPSMYVEGLI